LETDARNEKGEGANLANMPKNPPGKMDARLWKREREEFAGRPKEPERGPTAGDCQDNVFVSGTRSGGCGDWKVRVTQKGGETHLFQAAGGKKKKTAPVRPCARVGRNGNSPSGGKKKGGYYPANPGHDAGTGSKHKGVQRNCIRQGKWGRT